jgi:hypothetical protein
MRFLLFISLLSLVACAKQATEDELTCASYVSPYMAVYPDGSLKKSNIALCSDSTYQVTSLADGETFHGNGVVVQLMDPVTGVPNYTTFAGQ